MPCFYWENRRIKAKKKENVLKRKIKSSFHQLLPELAAHDTVAFESYMRMDFQHFSKIVDCFSERLHKKDTVMRDGVKPAEMRCLAIRSLGCWRIISRGCPKDMKFFFENLNSIFLAKCFYQLFSRFVFQCMVPVLWTFQPQLYDEPCTEQTYVVGDDRGSLS